MDFSFHIFFTFLCSLRIFTVIPLMAWIIHYRAVESHENSMRLFLSWFDSCQIYIFAVSLREKICKIEFDAVAQVKMVMRGRLSYTFWLNFSFLLTHICSISQTPFSGSKLYQKKIENSNVETFINPNTLIDITIMASNHIH